MNRFSLLLFDLDGTLLTDEREIPDADVRALSALMRAGVRVGIATGRSRQSVEPYFARLKPNGPSILFNGARVWDPGKGIYLFEANLPRAEALAALALIRGLPETLAKATHVNLYFGNEILIAKRSGKSRESEAKDGIGHREVGDLTLWLEANSGDPVKLLIIADTYTLELLEKQLTARVPTAQRVRSERHYLELTRAGVTKGAALQVIQTQLGIPRAEIVSFGDNLNDRELLRESGLGVAMGQGHPELLAAADRVIGPNGTDAIRSLLRELFPVELSEVEP